MLFPEMSKFHVVNAVFCVFKTNIKKDYYTVGRLCSYFFYFREPMGMVIEIFSPFATGVKYPLT